MSLIHKQFADEEHNALLGDINKAIIADINAELGLDLESLDELENSERFAELLKEGTPAAEAYRRTQSKFGADDGTEERPDNGWCMVRMSDGSMEPRLYDGDVLYIRRQKAVNDGTVALVLLDGGTEKQQLIVRGVHYHKRGLLLVASNHRYETMFFEGDERERVQIIGRVMKLVRPLDKEIDAYYNDVPVTAKGEELEGGGEV